MVTKTSKSSWDMADNLRVVNLLDYSKYVVSDDWTSAFATAVTAAISSGYSLYIPGGIYNIGPQVLPDNLSIIGTGTLKLLAGSFGSMLTLGNNCKLSDITLDGNNTLVFGGSWYPVSITNKTDITIKNVKIQNPLTDAIHISGLASQNIRITGLEISNYTGSGITITSGSNIQISDCRIKDAANFAAPGNGIALISDGNAISDLRITNCTIRDSEGEGIAVTGIGTRNVTDITITNCTVSSSTRSGIRVTFAERVVITSCTVKSNLIDGIRLSGDVQFCRIGNCSAVSNIGVSMEEVTSGTSPNNNTFSFNVAASNGNNSILILGASSRVV